MKQAERSRIRKAFKQGGELPVKALREIIAYDPDTGAMMWAERCVGWAGTERLAQTFNDKHAGKPALQSSRPSPKSSPCGKLFGRTVVSSQAAYALAYGHWPKHVVQFVNGDPTDFRKENMQDVPMGEICHRRALMGGREGKDLPVGITLHEGKRFRVRQRGKFLGYASTLEEAERIRKGGLMAEGLA